jgi:outer membrane protein OmpA-like peptidoglycan-associated protein
MSYQKIITGTAVAVAMLMPWQASLQAKNTYTGKQINSYDECKAQAEKYYHQRRKYRKGGCLCSNISHDEVVHYGKDSAGELDFIRKKKKAISRLEDQIAEKARDNNGVAYVCVSGHTDSDGDAGYNRNLSLRRARSVVGQLRAMGILRKAKVFSVGHGESRPVRSNNGERNMAYNRRTEIQFIYMYPRACPCPVSARSGIAGLGGGLLSGAVGSLGTAGSIAAGVLGAAALYAIADGTTGTQ